MKKEDYRFLPEKDVDIWKATKIVIGVTAFVAALLIGIILYLVL